MNVPKTESLAIMPTNEERTHDFYPRSFDEYIGQSTLKTKLAIYTKAAIMRNEPLDHLLFFGPPGLGKTTLAQIMAHIMQVPIKICSGPTIERTGDMVAILSSIEPNEILFIDEIHRLPNAVEEILYTAMEQFKIDVIIGQGIGAKSVTLPLPRFTLIGATTKSGMISAPLRSRFGIIERFDFYTIEELAEIITQNSIYLKMPIEPLAAQKIGVCGRGTPRIAKKLLLRVRDFAQVHNINTISLSITEQALQFLGLDNDGLSPIDRLILHTIITHANGGPIGLETLAALIGEDKETLETVHEPYLLRIGLLEKTSRGRQIPHHKKTEIMKKNNDQTSFL